MKRNLENKTQRNNKKRLLNVSRQLLFRKNYYQCAKLSMAIFHSSTGQSQRDQSSSQTPNRSRADPDTVTPTPSRPSILARANGDIIAFHLPRRGSWKAYLFLAGYPLSCIGDSRAGNASRLLARQRFKGCGCGRSYPPHESGHQCHAETRTNAPGKLHSG